MSERTHAAAWRSALETPLGQWSAYDYDDIPESVPDIYVVITVTRRLGGDKRSDGRLSRIGWRLTTLAVGRTADEARWAREKVTTLEGTRNGAIGTSLLELENETPIEEDNGRYSGMTVYTYATNA